MDSFEIPAEEKSTCLNWLMRMGINNFCIFPDEYGMEKDVKATGGIFNVAK